MVCASIRVLSRLSFLNGLKDQVAALEVRYDSKTLQIITADDVNKKNEDDE